MPVGLKIQFGANSLFQLVLRRFKLFQLFSGGEAQGTVAKSLRKLVNRGGVERSSQRRLTKRLKRKAASVWRRRLGCALTVAAGPVVTHNWLSSYCGRLGAKFLPS